MATEQEKTRFYLDDLQKHKNAVMRYMTIAIRMLADSAKKHDASKESPEEAKFYVDPVWQLNHDPKPTFGSTEYKKLTSQMGDGWKHHQQVNRHHPEHFENGVAGMTLMDLLEMVCDWCAAAERRGNDPALALDQMVKGNRISPELAQVIRNTITEVKTGTE